MESDTPRSSMMRPDGDAPAQDANGAVTCPFCGSRDVALFALFGSQLLTDQYYCAACHTPFEHVKIDVE